MNRRKILIGSVVALFLVGIALVSIPFIASLSSTTTDERPFMDIALADIDPGDHRVVKWRGKPVIVVYATTKMLDDLTHHTSMTWSQRSITDSAAFVYYSISPVHGCALQHAPKGAKDHGDNWPGGFFDPCHYGEWDYSGRALKLRTGAYQVEDLQAPRFRIIDGIVRLED